MFENLIARELTVWLCPAGDRLHYRHCPVDKLWFRRKPADNDNIVSDWTGGHDLIHRPDIAFPYSVECKDQKGWTFDGLLHRPDALIPKWWAQAKEQAKSHRLLPMLVFTSPRQPCYVAVDRDHAFMDGDPDALLVFGPGCNGTRLELWICTLETFIAATDLRAALRHKDVRGSKKVGGKAC